MILTTKDLAAITAAVWSLRALPTTKNVSLPFAQRVRFLAEHHGYGQSAGTVDKGAYGIMTHESRLAELLTHPGWSRHQRLVLEACYAVASL